MSLYNPEPISRARILAAQHSPAIGPLGVLPVQRLGVMNCPKTRRPSSVRSTPILLTFGGHSQRVSFVRRLSDHVGSVVRYRARDGARAARLAGAAAACRPDYAAELFRVGPRLVGTGEGEQEVAGESSQRLRLKFQAISKGATTCPPASRRTFLPLWWTAVPSSWATRYRPDIPDDDDEDEDEDEKDGTGPTSRRSCANRMKRRAHHG